MDGGRGGNGERVGASLRTGIYGCTGFGQMRISEAGATGLGGLQGGFGALADDLALALGESGPPLVVVVLPSRRRVNSM